MHQVAVPYADDSSKNVRDWFAAYKGKFKEDPSLFSAYGYVIADLFYQTAKRAGPNLTTDSFVKALESAPLRARHVRQPGVQVHRNPAPGQPEVARQPDPERQAGWRSPTTCGSLRRSSVPAGDRS
jgi:hypothetical protein